MLCLSYTPGARKSFDGAFYTSLDGVVTDCYCEVCHRQRMHGLLVCIWGEIHNLTHLAPATLAIEHTLKPLARQDGGLE